VDDIEIKVNKVDVMHW